MPIDKTNTMRINLSYFEQMRLSLIGFPIHVAFGVWSNKQVSIKDGKVSMQTHALCSTEI